MSSSQKEKCCPPTGERFVNAYACAAIGLIILIITAAAGDREENDDGRVTYGGFPTFILFVCLIWLISTCVCCCCFCARPREIRQRATLGELPVNPAVPSQTPAMETDAENPP